jgi:hypothetical protein
MVIQTTFVNGVSPFGPRVEVEKCIKGQKPRPRVQVRRPTVQRCDHITKNDVLAYVRANPGCTRAQMAEAFDRTPMGINKHMKVLVGSGVVKQVLARPDPRIRHPAFFYWAVQ